MVEDVILPTVIVDVLSNNGEFVKARALLDFGSQVSVIRQDFVNLIGLKKHYSLTSLTGIGGSVSRDGKNLVTVNFRSERNNNVILSVNAVVLKSPTTYVANRLGISHNISISDIGFGYMSRVDIIFGCDILGEIIEGNKVTLRPGGPYAIDTIFDYAVFGPLHGTGSRDVPRSMEYFSGVSLVDAVERFWKSEEPPKVSIKDPMDIECEKLFAKSVTRESDGKYKVRLPLIPNHVELGDSKQIAIRRFMALERRMKTQLRFKEKYVQFMDEYLKLGHMRSSDFDVESGQEYYILPHHGVFKRSGDTDKIRVVFDGSAKTSSGVSLNDCLFSGEKLQSDITKIILYFRLPLIVFTTDVKMMFRMTWIHPEDRRYQLILWRRNESEPIGLFELTTNTYGLKSSPFVAIRCLHQLAMDEQKRFPRAARLLLANSYVDDINGGADSIQEAKALMQELIDLMRSAGYELRKWASNESSLLDDFPKDYCEVPRYFDNDNEGFIKVLGVQWNPSNDTFTYRLNLPTEQNTVTRRSILSSLAKLFDPLGWICPVVFRAKLLLQELLSDSTKQVEWDAPAPDHLANKWNSIIADLNNLKKLAISRCLKALGKASYSLHGFCDGSSLGYAAAVYLRSKQANGEVSVRLIIGKSRLAPLRSKLTIPQLELNGATLLANLLSHTHLTLRESLEITEIVGWCDSTIVLAWLGISPHKLEVFQGNRVSQINNLNLPIEWHHIPGNLNCADVASRGCSAAQLLEHPMWWSPKWLQQPRDSWPIKTKPDIPTDLPGLRSKLISNVATVNETLDLVDRYSSFEKLINVTAYLFRFINNCRGQTKPNKNVSVSERRFALSRLIMLIQKIYFAKYIEAISGNKTIRDSLRKLHLFLDSQGLIRVGGRLSQSNLPYSAKHPILLPGKDKFTVLLAEQYHRLYCHVGANSLASILSHNYWILSMRLLTRNVTFKCISCFKASPRQQQPFMADLPADRVQCSRAFEGVGTDFAGPIFIKSSTLRNARIQKCYLCIFVCLTTKAVHLEVVSQLSMEAFIAAFSRFVSRRGLPSLIRSDCGTNYIGSNKYLKELYVYLRDHHSQLERELVKSQITWLFNPPGSPNMGGLFEAAVKSAKTHMHRVLGEQRLTFEELTTFFTKVEAVMNSRPLCPLSSDPSDLEVLTPGHFIIGQPLVALPEYPFEQTNINRLTRFQLIQKLTQHFWSRWRNEYLHTLQQRPKWTLHTSSPVINDLVLIKEDNYPPLQWKRGRIIRLLPGRDGINRVAELKTQNGTLMRPVSKLCRLPSN